MSASTLGRITLENAEKAFNKTWKLPGHMVVDRVTKVEGVTVFLDRTVIPESIEFLQINFKVVP